MGVYRETPLDLRLTLVTEHSGSIEVYARRFIDQPLSHVATSPFERSTVVSYRIEWNDRQVPIFIRICGAAPLAATLSIMLGDDLLAERSFDDQELSQVTIDVGFDVSEGREIRWHPFPIEPRFLAGENSRRPAREDAEYRVWFATTRCAVHSDGLLAGYSAERDGDLHYGYCDVFVPWSHKIGSTGSPWWKRLLTLNDDRLKVLQVEETTADTQWAQIASRLSQLSPAERHAVLFVHGYNVSFEDAALRAAQMGTDLGISAMAFFSWPSQGTLGGYLADAATIEANERAIARYMADFVANCAATTVHVIAHSMGNRGVLRAVNVLSDAARTADSVRFGQFILAAPDVDIDTFSELSAAYSRLGRRTTLYVCARDRAVEASHWLHRYPRVGLVPPVTVIDGIDTVNVTNSDLTFLGHGYVADSRGVLIDMHNLLMRNVSPAERFGLIRQVSGTGRVYWAIGA